MFSYSVLRERFAKIASRHCENFKAIPHPTKCGPNGEHLYVDIARCGRQDAPIGVVLVSGIHGAEGLLGSIVQEDQILNFNKNSSVSVLHIHFANPWGVAWNSRQNEDNVDVNRNFVDYKRKLPVNSEYSKNFHAVELLDDNPDFDNLTSIMQLVGTRGLEYVKGFISKGQYDRACGLFFGGSEESWSRLILEREICEFSTGKKTLVLIDIHTGLGQRGSVQTIVESCTDPSLTSLFPDAVFAGSLEAVSAQLTGTLASYVPTVSRASRTIGVVAECGTISEVAVLLALRGDNWRANRENITDTTRRKIDDMMNEAFAPDDREWLLQARLACNALIKHALNSLEAETNSQRI